MRQQLYAYIVDDIILKIKNNSLKQDEKLNTERELCEKYSASPSTVKKALKQLLNLGYIYSIERVGNYVCAPNTNQYIFNFNQENEESFAITSEEYTIPELNIEFLPDIKVTADTQNVLFIKKSYCSNTLIRFEKRFVVFKKGLFSNIDNINNKEISKTLKQLDAFAANNTLEIDSLEADLSLSEELGIKQLTPLFCIKKRDYDEYERLISFSLIYYKFDAFKMNCITE